MKQANAVRVGNQVSLNYNDLWLSFDWDLDTDSVYLATDADGEVWAYSTEPLANTKGHYINSGIEEIVLKHIPNMLVWKESVVQYTIK